MKPYQMAIWDQICVLLLNASIYFPCLLLFEYSSYHFLNMIQNPY